MQRLKNILGVVAAGMFVVSIMASCSQESPKPLTTEEIRANFIKTVTEELKQSSTTVDFRVEGTTLYMIDKSESVTGLIIIEKALKRHGVWVEDPNNTLGYFGSSLMKLGFTHFVSWSAKDKKLHTDELKYEPYKKSA